MRRTSTLSLVAGNAAGAALAGYLLLPIGGVGYLMQSPSVRNAVVETIAVSWQFVRIRAEERHLDGPWYAAYRSRVRWRLCPGLW